jgi:hypothetical protein
MRVVVGLFNEIMTIGSVAGLSIIVCSWADLVMTLIERVRH